MHIYNIYNIYIYILYIYIIYIYMYIYIYIAYIEQNISSNRKMGTEYCIIPFTA